MVIGKTPCALFPGLVSLKALIEESEVKKFPDNDLLRHLRLVTQDAEKCATVAQQLLNGKRQTRCVFGLRILLAAFSSESGSVGSVCCHGSPACIFTGTDLVEENPRTS